jgi:Neprosin
MVDYAIPETVQPDVRRWLERSQSALQVTTTTTTPAGQILDWVPIEGQTSEPIAEPPPAVAHHVHDDPARPTKSVQFDIGEAGPAGHVPILRPDLTRISSLDQLERVQSKSGGLRVNPDRRNTKPTDPKFKPVYFHASSFQQATLYGADARLNVWDPVIDMPPSPPFADHSISQLWLLNQQRPLLQAVEGGWTVDLNLNGDFSPHLFTYYTTNGYGPTGNGLGGYNRLQAGWIQVHPSIFPGITLSGISQQGLPQFEIGIKYELFLGNWWFAVNFDQTGNWTWLGFYPSFLFSGGLANYAETVEWGGEVATTFANPCFTDDQMGSGRHAADGWTHACYQRNIHNQTDLHGDLANYDGIILVDPAASNCPTKYTIKTFMNSGTNWGSYQYFGGPEA